MTEFIKDVKEIGYVCRKSVCTMTQSKLLTQIILPSMCAVGLSSEVTGNDRIAAVGCCLPAVLVQDL